jgi:dUTP pyrophosphatase
MERERALNRRNRVVEFQSVAEGARLPVYGSSGASGMDVFALEGALLTRKPERVRTGLRLAHLDPGTELQVRPRSGNTWKRGYTVANAPGTIDSDYRGEIDILLVAFGDEPVSVQAGDRIAQLVLAPVLEGTPRWVDSVIPTERGEAGFGSTGA